MVTFNPTSPESLVQAGGTISSKEAEKAGLKTGSYVTSEGTYIVTKEPYGYVARSVSSGGTIDPSPTIYSTEQMPLGHAEAQAIRGAATGLLGQIPAEQKAQYQPQLILTKAGGGFTLSAEPKEGAAQILTGESYKVLGTTPLGAVMVQPSRGGAIIYENPQYFKEHYQMIETETKPSATAFDASNIFAPSVQPSAFTIGGGQRTASTTTTTDLQKLVDGYSPSQQLRNVSFPASYITPYSKMKQGLEAGIEAQSLSSKLAFLFSPSQGGGILSALEYGAAAVTNQTAALERTWAAERYNRALSRITNPVAFSVGELQQTGVQAALMLAPWGKLPPALSTISKFVGGITEAKLISSAIAEPTPKKIGAAAIIPAFVLGSYVLGKIFPSTSGKPVEVKAETKSDVYVPSDMKVKEAGKFTAKTKVSLEDAKTIITGDIPVEEPGVVVRMPDQGASSKYMVSGQPNVKVEQQMDWLQRILGSSKVVKVTKSVEDLMQAVDVKKVGAAGGGEFDIDRFVAISQAAGGKVVSSGYTEEIIKSPLTAITDFGTSVSQSMAKIYGKLVGKTTGGQIITGTTTGVGTTWDMARVVEGGGLSAGGGGASQAVATGGSAARTAVQAALTGKLVGIGANIVSATDISSLLATGIATGTALAVVTGQPKPSVKTIAGVSTQGVITGLVGKSGGSNQVVLKPSENYYERLVSEGYITPKKSVSFIVTGEQQGFKAPPHPYGEPTPIPSPYDLKDIVETTTATPHIIRGANQAFTSLVGTIYPKSGARVRKIPAEISESMARETNIQELLTGEEAEQLSSKKTAIGMEVGLSMAQPTRQQPRVQPITSLETGEAQQQKLRQLMGQTLGKEYAQKKVVNPFATAVNVMTGTPNIPVPVYNLPRDIGRVSGKQGGQGGWTYFIRQRSVATPKQVIQLLGGSQKERKTRPDFRRLLTGSTNRRPVRRAKAMPKGKKKKDWRNLF